MSGPAQAAVDPVLEVLKAREIHAAQSAQHIDHRAYVQICHRELRAQQIVAAGQRIVEYVERSLQQRLAGLCLSLVPLCFDECGWFRMTSVPVPSTSVIAHRLHW